MHDHGMRLMDLWSWNMNKKLSVIIFFNLMLSVTYIKQLFYPGQEVEILDVDRILITPFVLFYNFLAILILMIISNQIASYKVGKRYTLLEKIPFGFLALILLAFIIFPLTFLKFDKGSQIASPLLVSFLEPFKARFVLKQSIKSMFIKNLCLFIISFVLFFCADLFPTFNALDGNSWPLYFGGLYFLFLAFLDFYFRTHVSRTK
jgi:hypothetical protein